MGTNDLLDDVLEVLDVGAREWLADRQRREEQDRDVSRVRAERRARLERLEAAHARLHEVDLWIDLVESTPSLRRRDEVLRRLRTLRSRLARSVVRGD